MPACTVLYTRCFGPIATNDAFLRRLPGKLEHSGHSCSARRWATQNRNHSEILGKVRAKSLAGGVETRLPELRALFTHSAYRSEVAQAFDTTF